MTAENIISPTVQIQSWVKGPQSGFPIKGLRINKPFKTLKGLQLSRQNTGSAKQGLANDSLLQHTKLQVRTNSKQVKVFSWGHHIYRDEKNIAN